MDHFTIFQDFYRVIAEMTEEEIVSAISNGSHTGKRWRTCAESSRNKAKSSQRKENRTTGNHLSANYREDVQTQLSSSIWDTSWYRHRPSDTGSIGTHPRTGKSAPPASFHQPKGNGTENRGTCVCRTDGTLPKQFRKLKISIMPLITKSLPLCPALRSWGRHFRTGCQPYLPVLLRSGYLFQSRCHSCHRGTATDVLQVSKEEKGIRQKKRRQHQTTIPSPNKWPLNYHFAHFLNGDSELLSQ